MNTEASKLLKKIETKEARIGVIGLGYVGLPLVKTFLQKGFRVTGFDIDPTNTVAEHIRKGQLVVLESTTYPGTTDEEMLPILEAGGLRGGRDFFLAFSPEREDPGNKSFSTATTPKVVGGLTPDCLRVAKALYDQIIVRTVPVSSTKAAESTKLLENIFRSVKIALVNEA